MRFVSREDAGQKLGARLRESGVTVDLVLGLPRGGVVVAAQVAAELQCPLDVFIVRKIGHPLQREFAVGAIAEPDIVSIDEASFRDQLHLRAQLEAIIGEETQRLREYRARFHSAAPPDLFRRAVLIVDDGLATGATAEAAVRGIRHRGARKVVMAAPVGSVEATARLKRVADEVCILSIDPEFEAVGQFYDRFDQTTDDEVMALLNGIHS
jgi:putative phosphoribosyl transferase